MNAYFFVLRGSLMAVPLVRPTHPSLPEARWSAPQQYRYAAFEEQRG